MRKVQVVVPELVEATVPPEATALDKVEPGWERRMEVGLPAHRPARQVRTRWENRQAVRRNE
jgi:hypothetical protein